MSKRLSEAKISGIEGFKGDVCHALGIHIFTNINTKNNNIDML